MHCCALPTEGSIESHLSMWKDLGGASAIDLFWDRFSKTGTLPTAPEAGSKDSVAVATANIHHSIRAGDKDVSISLDMALSGTNSRKHWLGSGKGARKRFARQSLLHTLRRCPGSSRICIEESASPRKADEGICREHTDLHTSENPVRRCSSFESFDACIEHFVSYSRWIFPWVRRTVKLGGGLWLMYACLEL